MVQKSDYCFVHAGRVAGEAVQDAPERVLLEEANVGVAHTFIETLVHSSSILHTG